MKIDLILLGSGSSTGVPWFKCLLEPNPCKVCLEANESKKCKNRRRNPSLLIKAYSDSGAQHVVIDVGKTFRDGVETFFPDLGVQTVDGVILTHDHADAILGLDDIRDLQHIRFIRDPVTGKANVQCDRPLPLHACSQTLRRLYSVFSYLFPHPLPPHLSSIIFPSLDPSPSALSDASPSPCRNFGIMKAEGPLSLNHLVQQLPVMNATSPTTTSFAEESPSLRKGNQSADLPSISVNSPANVAISSNPYRPPPLLPIHANTLNTNNDSHYLSTGDFTASNKLGVNTNCGVTSPSPAMSPSIYNQHPFTPTVGTTYPETLELRREAHRLRKENSRKFGGKYLNSSFGMPLPSQESKSALHPASVMSPPPPQSACCPIPHRTPNIPVNQSFVASIDVHAFEAFIPFETAAGISIVPLPVEHGKDYTCWAFEFNSPIVLPGDYEVAVMEGTAKKIYDRVVYMSDVSSVPDITLEHLTNGPRIKVLYLDCVFWGGSHPTHIGRPDALALLEKIKPEKCVFVGMSHGIDYLNEQYHLDLKKDSERIGVDVQMGFDGMRENGIELYLEEEQNIS
eukprot:GDKJ01014775.1.p1 GENE.GDKJ01014775.1~~GDKJ01014775.1.p1  ORF type:complete len:569 (-),score=129.69 GDKJ01014775.1:101-1807(-)